MVACRHSIALRERRQPKMLPEILDDSSLLCGKRHGKVGAAAQEVVYDRLCGGGLRRLRYGGCERHVRVHVQSAAARLALESSRKGSYPGREIGNLLSEDLDR